MTLHTLSASPASSAFADCLRFIGTGDVLLLLGDGVYAALPGTSARSALEASGAALFALHDDAAAAGILARLEGITVIDMEGFVALTEQYSRHLGWY